MSIKSFFGKIFIKHKTRKAKKHAKKNKKKLVSTEQTNAALSEIRIKTETRLFVFGAIVSIVFLCFYVYLIYLNIDNYSLRHIIIYSILSVLLIISLIFNIVLNPLRTIEMSKKEKREFKSLKKKGKIILLSLSIATKIVSVGFMLYEIIAIDSSLKRIIPFGVSTFAITMQLLVIYITHLLYDYYSVLTRAIDNDIEASGLMDYLLKEQIIKNPIKLSDGLDANKINKLNDRLKKRMDSNIVQKNKNHKETLYEIVEICVNNPNSAVDEIRSKFCYSLKNTYEFLDELRELEVITYKKNKPITILINDLNAIKDKIYNS